MENVFFLLKILGGVIGLGIISGFLIGKYLVKRASSNRTPILTKRERLIYGSSVALGIAVILFGIFFKFPESAVPEMGDDSIVVSDEVVQGGGTIVGGVSPRRVAIRSAAPGTATAVAILG